MSQSSREGPQPPKPPEMGRELQLRSLQLVGVSLLSLIVVLALFGVFGPSQALAGAEGAGVDLEVSYPSKLRYKTVGVIEAKVVNNGETALESLKVSFDRSYLDGFSSLQFTPSVSNLTDQAYEVTLSNVAPGEVRLVSVQVQAEKYWRHRGYIEVDAGNGAARLDLSTLNFP